MSRIRVGIIGCGRIADMHASAYRDAEDAEIIALCDTDEESAARRARQWGVKKVYGDYQELLEDGDVDLVEILTPHHLHCRMTCDAARAKKHVSVQKPMAVTAKECDEMIKACFLSGVQLKVFENFIFYPPFVFAKRLIEDGEIGQVLTLRIKLGALAGGWHVPLSAWIWRFDKKRCGPGPTLFDDGYHKFSMAVDLFGRIDSVKAWVDTSLGVIDAPAMVSFTYRDHPALGVFEAAFTPNARMRGSYYSADERIEINGTRGRIILTRCTGKLMDHPPLILIKEGRSTGFLDLRHDWIESFKDSTRHFLHALRHYRTPKLTGETGKHILQVAYAAYISSREGRRVDPDTVSGEELS